MCAHTDWLYALYETLNTTYKLCANCTQLNKVYITKHWVVQDKLILNQKNELKFTNQKIKP
jgi:hypothetical protein